MVVARPRPATDVFGVAVRNNLWDWQSLSPSSGYGAFHAFCDALEVKNGVSAGPKGWGLAHALPAWAAHWTGGYYADRESSTCQEECYFLT